MNQGQGQAQAPQTSDGRHDDDATLSDFLASLMDFSPTIPDELVEHYLAKSGFQSPDARLIRLVTVATQKFISEVATDALHICEACGIRNRRHTRVLEEFVQVLLLSSKRNVSYGKVEDLLSGLSQRHCKARQSSVVKDKRDKQQKDKRLVLMMEDLSRSLKEYGVNLKHQEYFADSPSTGMDPTSRDE